MCMVMEWTSIYIYIFLVWSRDPVSGARLWLLSCRVHIFYLRYGVVGRGSWFVGMCDFFS